jgi:hypothetical protein
MTTQSTLPAGQAVQTTLRPMRPEDLASCHAMSLHLYWPHRLADWQFHHQVSSSWAVELEQPDGTRSVAGSGMLCRWARTMPRWAWSSSPMPCKAVAWGAP